MSKLPFSPFGRPSPAAAAASKPGVVATGAPGVAASPFGAAAAPRSIPAPVEARQRPAPVPGPAAGAGRSPFSISSEAKANLEQLAARARAQEAERRMGQRFIGSIHDIKMFREDWGKASLVCEDFRVIALTGAGIGELTDGDQYEITAVELPAHPRYGASYEITSVKPYLALNEAAITKFIAGSYKGIGDALARRFVKAVIESGPDELAKLRNQLVDEPWNVDFSLIKKESDYKMEAEEVERLTVQRIRRDLVTRFTSLNATVSLGLAKWAYAAAVLIGAPKAEVAQKAWAMLQEDPYSAIFKVGGYSFSTADEVGRSLGIKSNDPVRLRALAAHAVLQGCNELGHVFIDEAQAAIAIRRIDSVADVASALGYAADSQMLSFEKGERFDRIYPERLLAAERKLAARLAVMAQGGDEPLLLKQFKAESAAAARVRKSKGDDHAAAAPVVVPNAAGQALRDHIQKVAKTLPAFAKNGLDESQVDALESIITSDSRVHTLVAGPGCGKTAVVEVLLKLLSKVQPLLGVPTGKGAKVLTKRVSSLGYEASTLNSLLKGSSESGCSVNAEQPLQCDLLVVDEASMLSLSMASHVFEAIAQGTHILILGDTDQLASIEPGDFLRDVLQVPGVDNNRLTTTHRNDGGILEVVQEVRDGHITPRTRADVEFSGGLADPSVGFPNVMAEYLAEVRRCGEESVALLMSRRAGKVDEPGWNTTYANERLRQVCNPDGGKIPGIPLREGDRIIVRENMTIEGSRPGEEERVVNGDTGKIIGFKLDSDRKSKHPLASVTVRLDDGRTVDIPGSSASHMALGYALTIHAAQGSEYKSVISVVTGGRPTFINRSTIYTGLSRARERLSVHATNADLVKIAATPVPMRNSTLVQRCESIREGEAVADQDPKPALRESRAA